ncbi:hypothetical protein [Halosimplex sp. J119]
MTVRRPVLFGAVAVLTLIAVAAAGPVGPASAAPPPESLCGVCGDGFAEAAEYAGVPLTVEHGVATIDVHENGTGHWHAQVRVSDGAAERFAANATLREYVVREALDRRSVVGDPRDLRTSVKNGTLVVDFAAEGVAHRSATGAVLVDLLDGRTRRSGLQMEADELRIRGPEGMAVTRTPTGAAIDGNSVVWRAEESGVRLQSTTGLAFAPTDGPLGRSATSVAVVGFGLTLVGSSVLFHGVLPALFLGGVIFAVRRWGSELPAVDSMLVAKGIVGVGATVVVAVGAASVAGSILDAAVAETVGTFAGVYALVAAGVLALDRPSARAAFGWTVLAAAIGTAVASVVSVVALQTALLSIPAALWFPLGRAAGRSTAVARSVTGLLVVSPVCAAVLFHPPSSPLLAVLLSIFTTIPWAGATILFGVPLYLLGRGIGEKTGPDGEVDPLSAASAD